MPDVMVTTSVPRRFTVFNSFGTTNIKFGYGSEENLKTDNTIHPSEVVLNANGCDPFEESEVSNL